MSASIVVDLHRYAGQMAWTLKHGCNEEACFNEEEEEAEEEEGEEEEGEGEGEGGEEEEEGEEGEGEEEEEEEEVNDPEGMCRFQKGRETLGWMQTDASMQGRECPLHSAVIHK